MAQSVTEKQAEHLRKLCEQLTQRVAEGMLDFDETVKGLQELKKGGVSIKAQHPFPGRLQDFDPVDVNYAVKPDMKGMLNRQFMHVSEVYASVTEWKRDQPCLGLPTQAVRKVSFTLLHCAKPLMTPQMLMLISRRGFRPAIFEELLAFAKAHPRLQREFPIVALGSYCILNEGRAFGMLCVREGQTVLSLSMTQATSVWSQSYRFLIVKKDTKKAG